jgi:hypothetical protein
VSTTPTISAERAGAHAAAGTPVLARRELVEGAAPTSRFGEYTVDATTGAARTRSPFTDPDNVWGDGTLADPATLAV